MATLHKEAEKQQSICLTLVWFIFCICSTGPQLRSIDKGDKEVIKFFRRWQASDKVEFCHCYVDTLRGVDKRSESIIKVTKSFRACAVYTILPFVTYRVVIQFSYITLLCHPCQWVVIGTQEPNYEHLLKSNECSFVVCSLYCWYYAFSLCNEWIDHNDVLSIMISSQNVQELSFNESVTNITTPRGSRYIENVIASITNW